MGNVGSRIDDSGALFLKDQNRCQFFFSDITFAADRRGKEDANHVHAIT